MIYPNFPKKGDVIGICAPSAGVGGKSEFFDMSLAVLDAAGFQTYETASVRSEGYPSASGAVRGAEFNSLFADDDVAMVMSAAGGDYNVEMLPYMDGDIVRSHPKWFAGYSDPTSIEMFMTTVCDIATIYGVNAGAWDWRPLHKFQKDALAVIAGELPMQHSYRYYSSEGFNEETGTYEMDMPVKWLLLRGKTGAGTDEMQGLHNAEMPELHEEYKLDVTGRLIGGCIDVIDWVIGTPYEDLKGFAERYRDDGLIWFFDNFELNPMNLMYTMIKMKHMGLFRYAKAVIFGRTCFPGEADDLDYLCQLERVFGSMDVPVIWNADIGHTKPSMTIINGAIGHLVYDHGAAELTMELK